MWLGLIFLVGAGLRWHDLGSQPLWGDESLSIVISYFDYSDLFLRPVDPTPGLYYALQKLVMNFGTDPLTSRLPSFLAGLATLPVAFWLGRTLGGSKAGLWTALLISVMPEWVYYSQEARAYALLLLLLLLALGFLARALASQKPQGRDLIISGMFAIMALYTHVVAWFVVAPLALWAVIRIRRTFSLRQIMAWVLLGVLLVLPEINRAIFNSVTSQYTWLAHIHPLDVLRWTVRLLTPYPVFFDDTAGGMPIEKTSPRLTVASLAMLFTMIGAAYLVLGAVKTKKVQLESPGAEIIVVLCVIFPLTLYLFGFYRPVLVPRSLLPMQLGFVVLAAIAAARLKKGWVIIVMSALFLIEVVMVKTGFEKERWDEVAARVEQADPEDGVFLCPHWHGAAFGLQQSLLREGKSARKTTLLLGRRVIPMNDSTLEANDMARSYFDSVWARYVDGEGFGPNRTDPGFDPEALGDVVVIERCHKGYEDLMGRWFPEDRRVDLAPEEGDRLGGFKVYRFRGEGRRRKEAQK